MTEEQDHMLRTVLRNQVVILAALEELLTARPPNEADAADEERREHLRMDLGACSGLTHYLLEDLKAKDTLEESKGQTKN